MDHKLHPVVNCTMCGSSRVGHRSVTVALRNGVRVEVDADVCPACGEEYFDPEALDIIEQARANAAAHRRRKA